MKKHFTLAVFVCLAIVFITKSKVFSQLSGTYTIGTSGTEDYVTVQEAVDSLESQGVTGPVVMEISTGNYPEQVTIPAISGASSTNTITFKSATENPDDVMIYYDLAGNSNNYVILLNECDYIHFEYLTLANATLNSGYTRVIRISGTSEYNKFRYNTFIGQSGSPTSSSESIFSSYQSIFNNLEISHNNFQGGSYAVYFDTYYADTDYTSLNVKIDSNTINTYMGLYMEVLNKVQICGNEINSNYENALSLQGCKEDVKIMNNHIDSYCSNAHTAIYLNNSDGSLAFPSLIANNVVLVSGDNSDKNLGINLYNSDYIEVYHNTVYLKHSDIDGIAFLADGGNGGIEVQNNLFAVLNYAYAYVSSNGTNISTSDYNNYYTAGNYLGSWNGTNIEELADLRTANSKDANSMTVYPCFEATDATTGLVPETHWLDNKGTDLTGTIDYDIDSVIRTTTPDIGAYEFGASNSSTYSGTLTIQATGGDFVSFTAAVDSLQKLGISGPVTVNVENGTYSEQIILREIPGSSATDSVVIQSASGDSSLVTLQHNSSSSENNYTLLLNGAKNITLKEFTIKNTGASYARVVRLNGRASNNNIMNCVLDGNGNPANSTNMTILTSAGDNTDNLYIANNVFKDGDRSIYLTGANVTDKSNGITIVENVFPNNYTNIYLYHATEFDINGNYFNDFTEAGTHIDNCTYPYTIRNNRYSSTVVTEDAIFIDECAGSGDGGLVYNNFIHVENNTDIRGIHIYSSTYQSVYNNSVNLISTNSNARAYWYDGYYGDGNNMIIKNNNFVVEGPGYPLYVENGNNTISESDYNNLFTSGTYVANWSSTSYTDITSLNAASAQDTNSQSFDPGYASNSDLHINSYWIDDKGTPLAGIVTKDIDGEARDATNPDIGADEYTSTLEPYAGEYTIGTGGYFDSFAEAVDSLVERGVLDTVILKVISDTYIEQIVIPQIANVSSDAIIIFESQTGNASDVLLSYNPTNTNNYVVKFEGADYITFRNMSFQSGSDAYANIIRFEGKCEYNNFIGNHFQGRSESTNQDYDAIIYCSTNTPIINNLTISDNTFSNGSQGLYLNNDQNTYGENLEIKNNTMNTAAACIYVRHFMAPVIENNDVTATASGASGINMQECNSAASYGFSIKNNDVLINTYSSNGGIYIYNCDANPTFPGEVVNNVVKVGIYNSSRSMGIDCRGSDYINFYHNTVNITSNSNDLGFYSDGSNYLNIENNIFAILGDLNNARSTAGSDCYAIYIYNGTMGSCDYNNYYSPGRYVGYWTDTPYATLEEMSSATSKDAHSTEYFPALNVSTLKTNSPLLDNTGKVISSVTTDINDSTRSGTVPDIGAYEFTSNLSPIAAGTYTVGLGETYPTLDSMLNALMIQGISGPVKFKIIPGMYSDVSLSFNTIPGSSNIDSVIIESQSGDPSNTVLSTVQTAAHNYIVKLKGADNITFRKLTFSSGSENYSHIFYLDGHVQNINLMNNIFNGQTYTGDNPSNYTSLFVLGSQIVDSLRVEGNSFLNNSYGIYFGGNAEYNHTCIQVIDNLFDGQFRNMYFLNTKRPYIKGNELTLAYDAGIYLQACDEGLKVLENKVTSTDESFYAIFLNYCDGTVANEGLIANNFVTVIGNSGTYGSFGIKLDYSNYQRVYYNSVQITGSKGAAFHTYQGGNIKVINNIFSNTGTTTRAYQIQSAAITTASDYNNFYSTGTSYIYYDGTNYYSLADYQAASLKDAHSLDYNPVFTSESDLHLLADSVVGKAMALSEVITDFDGEPRDATNPDIGADEFSCQFFPSPTVEDVTACSNDSIPALYAEGSNIRWYSDRELTDELFAANEYDPGISTAGEYTFYVTQSAGECTSDPDSALLTIYAAPELSADITHIDCQGTDYGAINLTVSGSTASPFKYLWSNDEITEDIQQLDSGEYIVEVEDLNGCIEIDTFEVTAPDPLILDITTQDTECDTTFGKATVVVTGGDEPYTYHWSNGGTGKVIDSLESGVYIVTVTDNRGCSELGVATINDIGAPSIAVNSVTDVSCYGGSDGAINLTVSGGVTPYEYVWSNGDSTEDISNIIAGQYEFTVLDGQGCKSLESIVVDEPDPIKISLHIAESACGQANGSAQAVVTGGSSPYIYEWSTGSTATSISNLDLGSYSITVTDDHSCEAIKYFSVSEIGAPSVIVDSIFEGTCGIMDGAIYISVYGSSASYDYLWSNTDTTEDLTGVNPGTYSVTVSDQSGCDAVQVATIDAEQPMPNPICLVSVDSATNYNEVVWEKMYTMGVDYYNVYKESTQSDKYFVVGQVDAESESIYVDSFSNVMERSWRYKLAVVDSCGVESELSDHHKTMHLTINLGINQTINLIWDHYEGFDFETYYIHRKSNVGWELIDSVPSNLFTYTDSEVPLDQNVYYMIEVIHPTGCDPTKAGKNTTRSNISIPGQQSSEQTGIISLDNSIRYIDIYPNPSTGIFTLSVDSDKEQFFIYEVYNLNGQIICNGDLGYINGKSEKPIDLSDFRNGIYFIKVKSSSGEMVKKLLINK